MIHLFIDVTIVNFFSNRKTFTITMTVLAAAVDAKNKSYKTQNTFTSRISFPANIYRYIRVQFVLFG